MREYDFNNSLLVGEEGEQIVATYLHNLSQFQEIKDVRDYPEFRTLDIDFVAKTTQGEVVSLEIKTDTYDTGNLFYETFSCVETSSIGCMEKTNADYILYYFTKTKELYILHTEEFRKWVNFKSYNFRSKKLFNIRHDQTRYTSMGYLIPKKYIEGSFEYYLKIKID